ncbi:MAG: cytochrome b/b6 domain-containing protein [Burkholderiaceae bacterium]
MGNASSKLGAVRVWDLSTRLFHWTLATLTVAAFATIYAGEIDWHFQVGYALLALLIFRLLWGFAGPLYARFASFPPSLVAARAYLRGEHPPRPGHNPLGAFSVYAILLVLLTQALLGLFANDGSFTEGPLVKLVASGTSDWATRLHKWNQWVIVALVVTHIAAIFFYLHAKRENLVAAMLHGHRHGLDASHTEDGLRVRARALILLAISTALVGFLIKL